MSDLTSDQDPLDALAGEYLDRLRRGERPNVSDYAAKIPERAEEFREFLSALMLIEDLKPREDDTALDSRVASIGLRDGLERLGEFRILRELGRGGMGVVYEAEQESLGRHVALKVLSRGSLHSEIHVQRFLREARAAAQLHHTNIVPVFGMGEHEGLHYYTMQFIRGLGLDKVMVEVRRLRKRVGEKVAPIVVSEPAPRTVADADATRNLDPAGEEPDSEIHPKSIKERLRVEPPDSFSESFSMAAESGEEDRYAKSVARIGAQAADALDYAHRQGTLHRDIKPSNILLDAQGVAWVADFGLAKVAEEEDLTRTGDFVGTIRYMAPERFRGRCDARSDVYGLGLTLYELLALRPAFEASDHESLFHQVNHVEPPRLRLINPRIPRDLETIVHKAIEKEAGHRYETAGEFAKDLQRFIEDRTILARRVSHSERMARWAKRNPSLAALGASLAAALLLLVVVIAVSAYRLREEHFKTVVQLKRAEAAETDALDKLLESYIAQARASRRGRHEGRRFDALRVIQGAARLDTKGLHRDELRNEAIASLALTDIQRVRLLSGRLEDRFLGTDFDPSSGKIAEGAPTGEVIIRDPEAPGEPTRLPENGLRAVFLRFSDDGRYLAVKHESVGRSTLVVWDLRRIVKVVEVPEGLYGQVLDFHPDSKTVAAARRDGSIVFHDLILGKESRRLPPVAVAVSIRFDPKGERLAIVCADARAGTLIRDASDGAILARWTLRSSGFDVDWRPDGRLLAVGTEDGRVSLLDPNDPNRPPRLLSGHDGAVISLAFHPDARLLATASWDGTLRLWDVPLGEELVKGELIEIHQLRFDKSGRLLGPGQDGAASWLWEVGIGAEIRVPAEHDGLPAKTRSIDFLGRENLSVSAGSSGIRLDSFGTKGVSAALPMPGTVDAAVSPDGTFLIASGSNGLLRWPISRTDGPSIRLGPPKPLGVLAGTDVRRVKIGRDGRTVAAIVDEEAGRMLVFDIEDRGPPVVIEGLRGMERLALDPAGRFVAGGTWKRRLVKVWDVKRGVLARELPVEGSADPVFSPDGRRLVTGSGEEYVVWNVGDWTPLARVKRSGAGALPGLSSFSPDGRILAVAHTRNLVRLLDAESRRPIASLEAPVPKNLAAIGFSPDGRALVATFDSDLLQIWDLESIQRGLASIGLNDPAFDVAKPDKATLSEPVSIAIEAPPWFDAIKRGEARARAHRSTEAAAAFEEAFALGARSINTWSRRVLFRRASGDREAYREACGRLLRGLNETETAPIAANDIAWACALGPGAVDNYELVIRLAEKAVRSGASNARLNTLGAVLYRAGLFEDSVKQLDLAVKVNGAGGTPYDAVFLAMAHGRLGHAEKAREWLQKASTPAPIPVANPSPEGDDLWITRLELEFLVREATETLESPVE